MNRPVQPVSQTNPKPVSPAAGVMFMMGFLGFFYGLITVVDPLL
jgi:hypothetical protein